LWNRYTSIVMKNKLIQALFVCQLLFLTGISSQLVAQMHYFTVDQTGLHPGTNLLVPLRKIESQSNALTLSYHIESLAFDKILAEDGINYDIVRLETFGLSGNVGHPALPSRTEKIALPDRTTPQLTVVVADYTEVGGYTIFPAQELPTDNAASNPPFTKNAKVYASNAYTPKTLASVAEEQTYKGTRMAFIQVNPVQYNPRTGKLRIYTHLEFRVDFIPSTDKSTPSAQKKHLYNSVLSNSIINPGAVKKSSANKSAVALPATGYILVTVPEFAQAAQALANWKTQLGYHVEILSQNNWTIAQVKNAINQVYNQTNYEYNYLLLLGDQEHIPDYYYENTNITPTLHVYSTNYYACMDGSGDYIPEMAHGRIPIQDTTQAGIVVRKIIAYEQNPPQQESFYKKGLHAGYFQDSLRDGTSDKRYARTTLEMYDYMTQEQGYNSDLVLYTEPEVRPQRFLSYYSGVTQVPDQYKKENGYAWDGDRTDISNALNEGRLYAFHRDHGQPWGWMQPQYTIDDVDQLHNGNLTPFVFSINCASGLFFRPESQTICFSEKLLRHPNGGAVGVVAATEETRSGYNDGLIIGMMDAIWPNPGIIPDMGSFLGETPTVTPHAPIYNLGDVMIQGLIRMTETWDPSGWADRDQFHLYHYFGDPAMRVWTTVPTTLTAQFKNQLHVGATSLTITSSNCPGAQATLCANNELIAKATLTDGSGTLLLPSPVSNGTQLVLTISAPNFRPLIAPINVSNKSAVRIMPLGNSLTFDSRNVDNRVNGDKYGYRKQLSELLTELDIPYDFVGSEQSGANYLSDPDNAGFPGITAPQLLYLLQTGYNQHDLVQETPGHYLDAYLPEIILLHIGTNELTSNVSALEGILNEIDAYKQRTGVNCMTLVAKITNQTPNNAVVSAYNDNLETLVLSRNDSTLYLVDMEQEAGLNYALAPEGDMFDQLHPTESGYVKMAQEWIDPIASITKSTTGVPQLLNVKNADCVSHDTLVLDMHAIAIETPALTLSNAVDSMQFDAHLGILRWIPKQSGTYSLRITAANSYGTVSKDFTINVLNSDPPLAPSNLNATLLADNSIALSWNDNAVNETGYEIERSDDGATFAVLASMNANSTSYTDTDVAHSHTYQYRVRCTNANGSSAYLSSGSVYVPVPSDPLVVGYNTVFGTPTYNNSRRAQVVTMPEDGRIQSVVMYHGAGSGLLRLAVYNDQNGAPGSRIAQTAITTCTSTAGWQEVALESPIQVAAGTKIWLAWIYQNQPEIRYTDGGPGRAVSTDTYSGGMPDAFGSSAVASYSYAIHALYVPTSTNRAPEAPSNLSGTYKDTRVELVWTDNSDNEDYFIVERSEANGSYMITGHSAVNQNHFTDSSLQLNTSYSYRVAAVNQNDTSEYSNVFSLQTNAGVAPTAPTQVTIAYLGNNQMGISWIDASDNETGFEIERSTTGVTFSPVLVAPANSEYMENQIDPVALSYQYRIRAVNIYGKSEFSLSNALTIPVSSENKIIGFTDLYTLPVYTPNRRAQQVTMTEDGVLQSISMYHGAGGGSVILAVYDDQNGFPGTRIATTGTTSVAGTADWQNFDLQTPVAVSSGSKIWLAFVFQNPPEVRYTTEGPGRSHSDDTWAQGMPDTYGSSTVGNYRYSIYARYTTIVSNPIPESPAGLSYNYNENTPEVSMTWMDLSNNEDGFIIERSIDSSAFFAQDTVLANVTSYTDRSIIHNHHYQYRIIAFNSQFQSAASSPVLVNTTYIPPYPPQAPQNITTIYRDDLRLIYLSWFDASEYESGYAVERSVNGGSFRPLDNLYPNSKGYSDYSVVYDSTYQYRIYAYNSFGNSGYLVSTSIRCDIPPTPPRAPESLNYIFNQLSPEIVLSWADSSAIENGFVVERSTNGSTYMPLVNLSKNTTTYTDPGIVLNANYEYRVYAYNQYGSSAYSNAIQVSTVYEPPVSPAAPGTLTVLYTSNKPSFTLNWTDQSDNETSFLISRSVDGSVYATRSILPANTETFADFDIAYNHSYQYQIFASNQFGNSATVASQVFTSTIPEQVPPVPDHLTLTYQPATVSVEVSWYDLSIFEDGYVLERSTNSGSYETWATLNANDTTFEDYNVDLGATYRYRVYATNAFGNSAPSDSASVTLPQPNLDPVNLGYTTVFPIRVQTAYRRAQPVTCTTNGSVESISMYFNPLNNGHYRFAVYSDNAGLPGQLLGSTPVMAKNSTASWNTAALSTPVTVSENQVVWLAWMFDLGTEVFYTEGTPGRAHSEQFWSTTFPESFGPVTLGNYVYSLYMTVQPNANKKVTEQALDQPLLAQNSLFLYPNPVSGSALYFSVNQLTEAADFQLEIRDLTGRILQKEQINLQPETVQQLQLDPSLNTSVLIFHLHNNENSFIQKVLVQQ